jgi:hypothetical protein
LIKAAKSGALDHVDFANEAVLVDQQSSHYISLLSRAHRRIGIKWLDAVSDCNISAVGV